MSLTFPIPFHVLRWGFIGSSADKEFACNKGNFSLIPGSIPGLGGSAGEVIGYPLQYFWALLVAQLVKNLPAMQETWVRSLDWEDSSREGNLGDPLENTGVAYPLQYSGLENSMDYSSWGCKESDMTEQLSLSYVFVIRDTVRISQEELNIFFSWVT